jgi:hypothetical protein
MHCVCPHLHAMLHCVPMQVHCVPMQPPTRCKHATPLAPCPHLHNVLHHASVYDQLPTRHKAQHATPSARAPQVVKRGTLRAGDYVVAGTEWGRVRHVRGAAGSALLEVGPGTHAQIAGLKGLPQAGGSVLFCCVLLMCACNVQGSEAHPQPHMLCAYLCQVLHQAAVR